MGTHISDGTPTTRISKTIWFQHTVLTPDMKRAIVSELFHSGKITVKQALELRAISNQAIFLSTMNLYTGK